MSRKRLLYIDDNNMSTQIDRLRRQLKNVGIELEETFFNVHDDKFRTRNAGESESYLNITKIKEYIRNNYFNENFDIVASDYDFKDETLDGYYLIKWIKNESSSAKEKIRKAKFCLYSAEQDKVSKSFDDPGKVRTLVKLKIDDFIKREDFASDIIKLITTRSDSYDFKGHVISFLETHGEKVFKNLYPKFEGKTLLEISKEIDRDSVHGIAFQEYLTELTLAHLIDLNKED